MSHHSQSQSNWLIAVHTFLPWTGDFQQGIHDQWIIYHTCIHYLHFSRIIEPLITMSLSLSSTEDQEVSSQKTKVWYTSHHHLPVHHHLQRNSHPGCAEGSSCQQHFEPSQTRQWTSRHFPCIYSLDMILLLAFWSILFPSILSLSLSKE